MGKKDKNKEKMSDALAEGIVELILTIIVGGLGFIICLGVSKLFSFKIDELDLDSFVLIGIAGLAVIVAVVALIGMLIKKGKK
jgi:formate-dependent nitrite reductase membrane component NrfD